MLSLYNWISNSKLASYCSCPIGGAYCQKLCLLHEVSKDEEEMEELESSIWEQAGLDWACVWVRRGFTGIGGGQIAKPVCPGTSLSRSLCLLSLPLPMDPSGYLFSSFLFVLGAASIMSGQLPVVGGGTPATRGRVPGGQGLSEDRICSGWVKGWETL